MTGDAPPPTDADRTASPTATASRRDVLAAAGSVLAVTAGCSAPSMTDGDDGSDAGATPTRTATDTAGAATTDGSSTDPSGDAVETAGDGVYARVYREVSPSVALVRVYDAAGPLGQGSGFVYDSRHVVTNQHVVEGATEVKVQFREGEWREASVVGTDVYSDLAVLRVPDRPAYADPLVPVDSEPPVGEEVVAIGAPFSLAGSASAGIVSGQNRSLPSETGFRIPDAVQTDAAVNPGNSGGPLVSLDGRVVGVINSGGGDNIGFAISAALLRRVVPALIEDGDYDHSYMGIRLRQVTPSIAEANDLDRARGVVVVEVLDGTPADGVLRGSDDRETVNGVSVPVGGDVVVEIDGRPIPTDAALSSYLAIHTSPGDTISITVVRGGARRTVAMTLAERPEP